MKLWSEIRPPRKTAALAAAVIIFCVGPVRAQADSTGVLDPLQDSCSVWIASVEASVSDTAAWVSPFAAPRSDHLTSAEMKMVLDLRRLSRNRDFETLAARVKTVAEARRGLPVPLRFWLAFAQSLLQQEEASLANLEALFAHPGAQEQLEPGQQIWALTALADYCFLLDQRERAYTLYGEMAGSRVSRLNLWGRYQLAGMEFLQRDFAEAQTGYQAVCGSEESGTWRDHACAMAEIAGRLNSLNLKGDGHGDLAVVSP